MGLMLRTVDTDVVLTIAAVTSEPAGLSQDCSVVNTIGMDRSCCMSVFHTMTGLGKISSFSGIDTKKAWDVQLAAEEVTLNFGDVPLLH